MQAEDLVKLGVVDTTIDEPQGGAHHSPNIVYENVKAFILKQREILKTLSKQELLEKRYQKFRKIGFQ